MAVEIGRNLPNLKITVGNDTPSAEDDEMEDCDTIKSVNSDETNSEKPTQDVQVVRKFASPLTKFRVYENKGGAFITGLDLSSEVVGKKLADRAARFGLEDRPKNPITDAEIAALYKSLDIDPKQENKSKNIRLDAVHVRGVEEMSTNDVFDYFKEYGPASVEWINDFSCNVVWLDETGAARALLGLSRVLVVKKKSQLSSDNSQIDKDITLPNEKASPDKADEEEVIFMSDVSSDDDDDDEDEDKLIGFKHEKSGNPAQPGLDIPMEINHEPHKGEPEEGANDSDIDVPVPPGHWRLGIPHAKAKAILLRFATKDDKKIRGAEKRSHYYKKYGNPNYGGLRGLISQTRKRKFNATKQRQVVEQLSAKGNAVNLKTSEREHDTRDMRHLRMRMHADDEEEKLRMKSAKRLRTVENNPRPRSIHERLGPSNLRGRRSFNESKKPLIITKDFDIKSSVSKPSSSKINSRYDVWTGLAKSMAKEESEMIESNYRSFPQNTRDKKDLRQRLKSSFDHRTNHTNQAKGDLRSKLERLRHSEKTKHRSPMLADS